jgi:hypothetical protein
MLSTNSGLTPIIHAYFVTRREKTATKIQELYKIQFEDILALNNPIKKH